MKRSICILFAVLVVQVMGGCASEPVPRKQLTPVIEAKAEAVPFSGYMYNCREQGNYGMFSYLVMAYPGNSQNFIETIQVFLEKTFKLNQQNKSIGKDLLNNVFIPLWSSPPSWVREVDIKDRERLDATARWIAQNYDYKCARLIMRSISKPNRNSIYVMSSLARLTTGGKSSIVMIQEVSDGIEPSRFNLINEFFKKTWHQRHWTEQSVKDVAELLLLAVEGNSLTEQLDVPASGFLSEGEPDQKTEDAQADVESQALAGSEETVAVPRQGGEKEKLQAAAEGKQIVISRPIDDVLLPTKGIGSGIITVVLPN